MEILKISCRKSLLKMGVFQAIIIAALAIGLNLPAIAQAGDQVSRAGFIKMISQNMPENSLLPNNHRNLSSKDLYEQTRKNLEKQGVNALNKKNMNGTLTHEEFLKLTYAFTGGSSGKNLIEQKLYLKDRGIIDSKDIGLTDAVEGKVTQYQVNQVSGQPIHLASPVFMKDRIETDLDSRASIMFDDQSVMTMSEDAVVHITKHTYDPDKDLRQISVNVSVGTIRFVVTKAKGEGSYFNVVTPTATAGVRGTEFVTDVAPGGETRFVGIESIIEVMPNKGSAQTWAAQMVGPNQTRAISAKGAASDVTAVSPEIMQKVQNKTKAPKKIRVGNEVSTTMAAANIGQGTGFKLANLGNFDVDGGLPPGLVRKADKEVSSDLAQKESGGLPPGLAKKAGGDLPKGLAKGSAKGAVKNVAKIAAKNAAKDVAKGVAKNAAKDVAKVAAKDAAKDVAKDVVKDVAKVAAKDASKDAAKNAAKDVAKVAAKDVAKEVLQVAAKDSAKNEAQSSARSAAKDTVKGMTKGLAGDAAKEAAAEVAKEMAKEAVTESAKDAAEEARESAKDAAEAAKEVAKDAAEAAKEAAKKDNSGKGNSGKS